MTLDFICLAAGLRGLLEEPFTRVCPLHIWLLSFIHLCSIASGRVYWKQLRAFVFAVVGILTGISKKITVLSHLSPQSTSHRFCGAICGTPMLTFLCSFVVVITGLQRAFHYFWLVHIQHEVLTAPLNTAELKEQPDKQSIGLRLICPIKSVKASVHDVPTGQVAPEKVLQAMFICSEPDAGILDFVPLWMFRIHFH